MRQEASETPTEIDAVSAGSSEPSAANLRPTDDVRASEPGGRRVKPEVFEALARARANVELSAKLAARDAGDEAEAMVAAGESPRAKRRGRVPPREGRNKQSTDETATTSNSDESFEIVPFE